MRKSRFSEEQIVKILREADAASVPQVAKKHGIGAAYNLMRISKLLTAAAA